MPPHFSAVQRTLLEKALHMRLGELDHRLTSRQQGLTRVDHAHEIRTQDGNDEPQRCGEREVDMTLNDMGQQALGAISEALRRIKHDDYGLCRDCGDAIPFERLRLEPWVLRCVACETKHECSRGARRQRVTL